MKAIFNLIARSVGITLLALGLLACEKVSFAPVELASKTSDPLLNLSCGDREESEVWWEETSQVAEECQTCGDRSKLSCFRMMESEMFCSDGRTRPTGNVRSGRLLPPEDQCPPPPPTACGERPDGTKWWLEEGTRTTICEMCSDGSERRCLLANEVEWLCQSGQEIKTGSERAGRTIEYLNECPLPPRNCGERAENEMWWVPIGESTRTCGKCWNGADQTCRYVREGERQCLAGEITDTKRERDGAQVGDPSLCPREPRACGEKPDGAIWWVVDGSQEVTCETCSDGSARRCLREKEHETLCRDGETSRTPNTRLGKIIRYVNNCPRAEEEVVAVPDQGGEVDILLVLDTSGSMDRELEKMSLRLRNLSHHIGGLDWRIGIMNTAVGKGILDGFASQGMLMNLEGPNPHHIAPYRVIEKSNPSAERLFRFSISRSASQENNCDYPPYCMGGSLNQPLKAIATFLANQKKGVGTPLLRPHAAFVPIIISDSDERERGGPDATQPQQVIDVLRLHYGEAKKMVSHAVIIEPGDHACHKSQSSFYNPGGEVGYLIAEFVRKTGGRTGSICDEDFGHILSGISESTRQRLDTLDLRHTPKAGSVRVEFTPHVNVDVKVTGRKLHFTPSVPGGTSIRVRYWVEAP